jgi:hypothetical protein
MSISIKGVVYTPSGQIGSVSSSEDSLGIPVLNVNGDGFNHSYEADSLESAAAAETQINQAIADGHGGSTEILIVDDF